jgi:NAD(P)-dependent dehydrogenase (short-subunit alcohol dehydrogenase family)
MHDQSLGLKRACIFGASGGIGRAVAQLLLEDPSIGQVYTGSRTPLAASGPRETPFFFDLDDESSIADAAEVIAQGGPLDLVFIATGVLHEGSDFQPEKSWRMQDPKAYQRAFAINATGPALVGKHFLPLLNRNERSVFAALSARVGSIGDNKLGGWHAYRASKAALNMIVRNFAMELRVRNANAIAVTLHPGTVDTALSKPFQLRVAPEKLFTPAQAARHLLSVVAQLEEEDSGHLIAWDGRKIDP